MSRLKSIVTALFSGPVFWGCAASIGFYAAIQRNLITNELIRRYFAGRSVEYVITVLFFVALAALIIKFFEVVMEPRVDGTLWLPEAQGRQPMSDCDELLDKLEDLPPSARNSSYGRRLHDALESVRSHGSAEKLDDELRNMAGDAEGKSHARMSLVRVIISLLPVLGFLGTVIGITEAVAHLSKVIGEVKFSDAVNSVVGGLSEGFDATAVALALSMVLMFLLYFVNYLEARLLTAIEKQANRELVGRFQVAGSQSEGASLHHNRIADEVIKATQHLVERQSQLWSDTIEAAQKRWTSQAVTTERQLETALGKALRTSLEAHAQQIRETEQGAAEAGAKRWQQAVTALERGTSAIAAQQAELHQQGKLLKEVVDATGRVIQLEEALNRNLGALAGAHHFEQTVMSLSAAVNLLGARVGQPTMTPRVELRPVRNTPSAA